MKHLLFLIVILTSFSCKLPKFRRVESEKPNIVLKKGNVIAAEMVELQTAKHGGTKLIADNNLYLPKTVAYYSNGISTFGNYNDSLFAKKVVAGNINLFTNNLNNLGKPKSAKPFYFFAQKNPSNELKPFSYETLSKMIEPNNAANKYLKRYKTLRTISYVMGGLGLIATGLGVYQIIQDKAGNQGLPSNPNGVAIAASGVWCFLTFAIVIEENKVNLFRAVKQYNAP